MIGVNAPSLPPVTLTDEAMKLAAVLLAVAADPAGTRSRLDELAGRITAVPAAVAEHDAAAAKASEVAARETAVAAKEQDVASREAALAASQTQLQVASAAIADRDAALKAREQAFEKRQDELVAKEQALADRLEKYRQALAG